MCNVLFHVPQVSKRCMEVKIFRSLAELYPDLENRGAALEATITGNEQ